MRNPRGHRNLLWTVRPKRATADMRVPSMHGGQLDVADIINVGDTAASPLGGDLMRYGFMSCGDVVVLCRACVRCGNAWTTVQANRLKTAFAAARRLPCMAYNTEVVVDLLTNVFAVVFLR